MRALLKDFVHDGKIERRKIVDSTSWIQCTKRQNFIFVRQVLVDVLCSSTVLMYVLDVIHTLLSDPTIKSG